MACEMTQPKPGTDLSLPKPTQETSVQRWQHGEIRRTQDTIAEEVAVALVYNGISHVVMMTSPNDLADFALGFSLTEGILKKPSELYSVELVPNELGIEVQMTISGQRFAELKLQRRNLTGRTGCGLCGAESLQQAIRTIQPIAIQRTITDTAVQHAVRLLEQHQPMQAETGACHGAAWCNDAGEIMLLREDIGRHNALDKLIGGLQGKDYDLSQGFVLISSRASYEMVQKVAAIGIGALVAVSAPTGLALKLARQANLQLIGFARPQRHVRYSPDTMSDQTGHSKEDRS